MKPGIPWSVKGIGPEVREAAKHAARRYGMTLGEWLNSVILEQSGETGGADSSPALQPGKVFSAPLHPANPPREETALRLEDIAQQLSRLAQRDRDSAAFVGYEAPAARQIDADMLTRILGRIDSNERQTVEAFTAVNERLSVLGHQISQTARQRSSDRPEDVPGYSALEAALRNVVDHMEVSEKRTRDTLQSLQDRMAEMAQRATAAASPAVIQSVPAFIDLESRLSELAERVGQSEETAQAILPDLLRNELTLLTERIERVRETAETLAERAETSAVHAAQHELRAIETRILALLSEAQGTLAGTAGNGAALERLRSEIGILHQRMDEVGDAAAGERDLQALRVAVEQLSTRVAQGLDLRPLADLDRRVTEITHRLEQDEQPQPPQFAELERRMSELDQRLSEALHLGEDGDARMALEQQIAAVGERVGRTEQQFSNLETIERAIAQLYEGLEQSRTTVKEVAEEAASRVVDRILNSGTPPSGPSPELIALEEGLRAVRESAASSDQRNQETLAAVHDTLEHIVTKLTDLEAAGAGQQPAAALPQEHPSPAEPWLDLPVAQSTETPQPATEPEEPVSNPFADFSVTEESRRPDLPLPQSLSPVAAGPRDDFIAAARRAAQAAAGKTAYAGNGLPGSKKPVKPAFKFQLPFRKAKSPLPPGTLTTQSQPPLAAANSNDGKRRRLLLAGILLLAAVSAFTFNLMGRSGKPVQPPAKVQSMIAPQQPVIRKSPVLYHTTDESSLPAPPDIVREKAASALTDSLLTGSIAAQKTDASLANIVAQPGSAVEQPAAPPTEIGPADLREAATRGDTTAQFIIASRYLAGTSVEQDLTKAAYWYQLAAARGLAPAQYRIATLFEHGRGVPQDAAAAFLWYERAAANGNVKAMHNAAVMAAGNQLGTPDYNRAFKWFSEASSHGLKDSQFNLAIFYERGLGTKANSSEALFWYTLAGKQNDADARKRASDIILTLPPAAAQAITRRADAWKPKPTADDANIVAVTDEGWKDLGETKPPAVPARQSSLGKESVVAAQRLLASLGFNVGAPDGSLSPRTANAIRLFQLQSGMKVTGQITPALIAAMQAKAG